MRFLKAFKKYAVEMLSHDLAAVVLASLWYVVIHSITKDDVAGLTAFITYLAAKGGGQICDQCEKEKYKGDYDKGIVITGQYCHGHQYLSKTSPDTTQGWEEFCVARANEDELRIQ